MRKSILIGALAYVVLVLVVAYGYIQNKELRNEIEAIKANQADSFPIRAERRSTGTNRGTFDSVQLEESSHKLASKPPSYGKALMASIATGQDKHKLVQEVYDEELKEAIRTYIQNSVDKPVINNERIVPETVFLICLERIKDTQAKVLEMLDKHPE